MKKIIIGTLLTIMIAGFYALFNNHTSKATNTDLPTLKNTAPIQVNQKEKSNGVTLTLKTVKYGKDQHNKDLLEMYFEIKSNNLKDTMEKIKKSKGNEKIQFEKNKKSSGTIELHEAPLTFNGPPRLTINGKKYNDFWSVMDFKKISNNKYTGLLQLHLGKNQPKHFKASMYFFSIVSKQGHWEFNFQT